MESKERYEYLGSRNTQHLISVASILCLLFGISAISIFTYNPVGVSFTSSIGLWLLSLGVSVRSRFFHKNYTSNQSNPWISGLLLSIAQFFASIASFYDPTNHGSVTTVLGLSIILPIFLFQPRSFVHYIGALFAAGGFGLLCYLSNEAWTLYNVFFSLVSAVALSIWWVLPRTTRKIENIFIATSVDLFANFAFFVFMIAVEIYPLNDEIELIYLGVISGMIIGAGAVLVMFGEIKQYWIMACCSLGLVQGLMEWAIFGNTGENYKFLAGICMTVGLEVMIMPQAFRKKELKVNDE